MNVNTLPPCPREELQNFLSKRDFHPSESLSDEEDEYWVKEGDYVESCYFPKDMSKIPFSTICITLDQIHCPLCDFPFYAQYFPAHYPGY